MDEYQSSLDELLLYTERKVKEGIKKIPNGTYEFIDYLDDDGINLNTKIPIKVRIIVDNEFIHLDFTGTSKQVTGGINVVYTALLATIYYALKVVIDPTIPSNSGYYGAIKVTAPEGTIVNAVSPAPVGGRTDACQRIVDVIFGALSEAVPEKVVAGCNSAVTTVLFSGYDNERDKYFVYPESIGGGLGARHNKDGLDGVHVHVTNSSNLPIESMEMEYPLLLDKFELRNDSGGAGKFRGGLGIRRDYKVLNDVDFATHGDRQVIPPWGLFGGREGQCGEFVINPDTKNEKKLETGKVSDVSLKSGDILSVRTPGSGGYGNPEERDKELQAEDALEGKVTNDV